MSILIYASIITYLVIGYSICTYIVEGGDKLRIGLLWLFGWGFYVILALVLMLIMPFVDLFKYIRKRWKIQH